MHARQEQCFFCCHTVTYSLPEVTRTAAGVGILTIAGWHCLGAWSFYVYAKLTICEVSCRSVRKETPVEAFDV